ncbi:hypothetical protein [Gemmobacter denitrificans]|uniref:Uncharacterized protein n=1 Tax=Gemmobacter denitrificans TaxID=3123040 RepID=A0ABU8BRA7_9RHOB
MRYLITSAVLALSGLATIAQAGPETWTTGPFDMPESAIHDAARDRIVLSLIGGHPGAADGNGALALLSPEGDILDPAWVTGLDAPKGMAIVGSTLLVADLTRLHEIDLSTGTLIRSLDVDGAVFLNDLTSDGQQAFVSDFMTNRIWRYEAGQLSLWMDDANLNHPNGLLLESDRLLVGSWGAGMRDDFSTEEPGSLLSINLADKTISVVAARIGNIDGVVKLGTHLLVNDWITGHLMKIDADGTARTVAKHAPGLADIATMGDSLLLPSMLEGTLSAQPYP